MSIAIEVKLAQKTKPWTDGIQSFQEELNQLDQKIAFYISEISQLKQSKENDNRWLGRMINGRCERLKESEEWREDIITQIKEPSNSRERSLKLKKVLQICEDDIRDKKERIHQTRMGLWKLNNRYNQDMGSLARSLSLSQKEHRGVKAKIGNLERRVESARRKALESPFREAFEKEGRRVEVCNRRNPNALIVPTPERSHAVSPNPYNRSGIPNRTHPDFIRFPSPGVTVTEADLMRSDQNTPQTEFRVRANLVLLEARVKEDSRNASRERPNSCPSIGSHFRYTEGEFKRVCARLQFLTSHSNSATREAGQILKEKAKTLHKEHQENGKKNGFSPQKLDFAS